MIRTFGKQTLNGSAQPWFGDVLTAAFTPPTFDNPGLLTVANTARYLVGDRIILGAGSAGQNIVIVDRIFSGTVLWVHSEGGAALKAWVNGSIIALDIACAMVAIQASGANSADIWIGSDNTVTNAGAGNAIADLTAYGVFAYGNNPQWNAVRTSDGWMAGANTNTVLVYAVVI
jgi:hypothetical protein